MAKRKSFFGDYVSSIYNTEKKIVGGIGKAAKAVYKGTVGNALKVDDRHNSIIRSKPGSYKKGGKVKKTGMAKVHKGERVLTKKQTKKFDAKKFESARKKLYNL